MTSPRPIFDGFFRDPFGGEMNPIGGVGGGNGVLENIQQQVADNGEALQALQGGIGGLPIGGISVGKAPPGKLPSPGLIDPQPIVPPMSEPPMVTGPGGDLPPNDMGFPPEMFGKINIDELNKQNPGIEKGFFESDEYNKFHYDPNNMMGTMDVRFSPYFGTQGSGSVGGAMDAAYEAYLKRIGKSDLIGKRIPGLSDNPFDFAVPEDIPYDIPQPIFERPGPVDPFRTPNLNTMEIGNVGGMDQLFGRAFAGKPI